MVQTIPAQETLHDLKTKFNLQYTDDNQFFREWQDNLLEISELEKQSLERIKINYLNLIEYPPMLENAVKMVVLSPLLDLAGFYQRPLRISTEKQVEIVSEVVKGIDVLVLQEQLWILVIEAKKAQFSLELGIPQALAYMLDNPNPKKPKYDSSFFISYFSSLAPHPSPLFSLVTNGSNFIFIKLMQQEIPLYALSDEFTLRRANDLSIVLRVLKQLGKLVVV